MTALCPGCLEPADGLVYPRRGNFDLVPLTVAPRLCVLTGAGFAPVGVLHFPPRALTPGRVVLTREPDHAWVWLPESVCWESYRLPFTVPAGGALVAVMAGPCEGEPVACQGGFVVLDPDDYRAGLRDALDELGADLRDALEPHSIFDHPDGGVGL